MNSTSWTTNRFDFSWHSSEECNFPVLWQVSHSADVCELQRWDLDIPFRSALFQTELGLRFG